MSRKKEKTEIKYKNEIWKKISHSKYEVSNYGRIRRLCKYKYRYLNTFKKGAIYIIKLYINKERKDYNVAKLVIENFVRKLEDDEVVYHKNGIISDNKLSNLEIITRSEAGKRTGWQSHRQAVVMLDEEGIIKEIYNGTRDAAEKLFISRQTVSDYCNNKVKKPMYHLYWAKNLIEKEKI